MPIRASSGKRVLDILLGGVLLLLSLPVQGVIALAVRLDSPGPILYQPRRSGLGGTPFILYKFRTMVADAAALGPAIATAGDSRVTRVGRFLRRTKLDELPQLWNVVRGDMSLVGPRPEDPRFVATYAPKDRLVLSVRPGLTGPSQLEFRNEERMLAGRDPEAAYVSDILPRKLSIDIDYVQQHSLRGDARILLRTLRALIS